MTHTRRQFLQFTGLAVGAGLGGFFPRAAAALRPSHELDLHACLQPVPDRAVFSVPGYHVWCGTMVRSRDGTCHLFYSRWPIKEGFMAWVTHSEVAHATADNPLGPYRHRGVVLPARGAEHWDGHCTHNPTVLAHGGRYYLYYMGNRGDRKPSDGQLNWSHRNNQRIGVAVADAPEGPWRRSDTPLIDVTPGFHDALMCSNPAVCIRPEGDVLMIYKAVGARDPAPFGGPVVHVVATAPQPMGPFAKRPDPVFTRTGVAFPAEDPFIWHDGERYWGIVKDMKGYFTGAGRSLALMQSANGFDWVPARHALVSTTEIGREDGTRQPLHALERPQLWLENGRPSVLFCAASLSREAGPNGSFNVGIPLRC
jgi:hypothetical protein